MVWTSAGFSAVLTNQKIGILDSLRISKVWVATVIGVERGLVESTGRRERTDLVRARRARLRLLAGVAAPVIAYIALDHALHNELFALAIVELIPVFWALAYGFSKRRLDPIALIALIVLLVALAVAIADGGSVMPLKLRRGLVTGTLGIACLVSVIGRRPLLPVAIGFVERAWPSSARLARVAHIYAGGERAAVLTLIVGVTLLLDAVAQVSLALTVSTAVFLVAAKLARTGILVAGAAACWYTARRAPRVAPSTATAELPRLP